jgi:hypothetical protein
VIVDLLNLLAGAANAQIREVQVHDPSVLHVAELQGKAQQKALRLLLTHPPSNDWSTLYDSVFYYEVHLRASLRTLIQDPRVGTEAVEILTRIGEPEDLRFIIQHPPPSKHQLVSNRWAYGVACSLLDATTEEEWSFLRNSALGKYDYAWVNTGAIQTLALISSPRSQDLLEEAQRQNQPSARSVARALEYVRSAPAPLTASSPEELMARVVQTIKIGSWRGDGRLRYNEAGDKALVDVDFYSGQDVLIYTATLYRIQGSWRLRGVREIAQYLMSAPPV